jgi:hypothetical protein
LVTEYEAGLKAKCVQPASGRVGGTAGADKEYQRQIDESEKPWREYTAIAEAVRKLAAG